VDIGISGQCQAIYSNLVGAVKEKEEINTS